MMGYRQFVPKLYNFCKSLGMRRGLIQPSVGFCSDESQGYPIIILTKHFGAFPFNHGQSGGIMVLDRSSQHADHGEDVVIIHAPHVGYDPATGRFGRYRSKHVRNAAKQVSASCGKMSGVLDYYRGEYGKLLNGICIRKGRNGQVLVSISNALLEDGADGTSRGGRLCFERLLAPGADLASPCAVGSASKVYVASPEFATLARAALRREDPVPWLLHGLRRLLLFWRPRPSPVPALSAVPPTLAGAMSRADIRALPGFRQWRQWRSLGEPALRHVLQPSMFAFARPPSELLGERNRLERELLALLPTLLAGPWDAELTGALALTQLEFARAVQWISKEPAYLGKNLLLVSGLNVDISPDPQDEKVYAFPSTNFLPWAAYMKAAAGSEAVLEQDDLIKALEAQSGENPDAVNVEAVMCEHIKKPRRRLAVPVRDRSAAKVTANAA